MKNRDILVVAEGPDDAKTIRKMLSAYDIYANHNIYEYQTNVYCLYDVLQEETDGDWEQIDVPMILRSRESNEEIKQMLTKRFTEIILIFDYDPQHTTYDYEKIDRLIKFFDDAGNYGKLYVDYPMIESVGHFIAFPNDFSYKNRVVTKLNLVNHDYKSIVHYDTRAISSILDLKKKGVVDNIIQMNLMKAKYMLYGDFTRINSIEEYSVINCQKILEIQAGLYETEEMFYVLCTCVFYLLDFDFSKFISNQDEN